MMTSLEINSVIGIILIVKYRHTLINYNYI